MAAGQAPEKQALGCLHPWGRARVPLRRCWSLTSWPDGHQACLLPLPLLPSGVRRSGELLTHLGRDLAALWSPVRGEARAVWGDKLTWGSAGVLVWEPGMQLKAGQLRGP